MKPLTSSLLLLGCALGCGGAASLPPPQTPLSPGNASLGVVIDKVSSTKGTIRCALFNAPEGFPGPSRIVGGSVTVSPRSGARCDFTSLPKGTYAVTVYHDANDNNVLDTNLFGAPTEGYGATQNHLPAASPPSFGESSVELADGATVTSHVQLRY